MVADVFQSQNQTKNSSVTCMTKRDEISIKWYSNHGCMKFLNLLISSVDENILYALGQ